MLVTIRKLTIILALPVFAVGFFLLAYFSNYQGTYDAPPSVHIPFEEFTAPPAPPGDFVDAPFTEVRRGTLLVDAAHRNRFNSQELTLAKCAITKMAHKQRYVPPMKTRCRVFTPYRETMSGMSTHLI